MGLQGCGGKFLKYSMFLFNAVILVAGCGLVGFGVYTRSHQVGITRVSSILGGNLVSTLSLIVIITGAIVILISFLGCCGAIKEVRCMLITFFSLLLLMFLGFVIGGILIYAFREKIENYTLKHLKASLETSYGYDSQVTEAWDSMQQIFQCCGVRGNVNGSESWSYYKEHSVWFKNQTGEKQFVPDSCCKDPQNTPNKTKCVGKGASDIIPVSNRPVVYSKRNDQMYSNGCYTALVRFLIKNIKIFTGVFVGIAAMMILGMVFALCLCRRIHDDLYCD